MKIKYFSSLIFFIIILSTLSSGQGLKFGIGGGLSTISSGFSGLSYNSGYHISAKAELDIPLFPLTPVVSIQYYVLNGNYSFPGFTGSTSQKIFSAGIGAQYSLLPGPISPYLALDLGFNNIGEISYQPAVLNQFASPAITRTGVDIGAGVEVKLPFLFNFDVSAKYNMLNLWGKVGNEGTLSAVNLNLTILF